MATEPQRVLIVGATSAIAGETARVYAAYGARLFLTGRHAGRLEAVGADLRVRGASAVEVAVLDVTDRHRCVEVAEQARTAADLSAEGPGRGASACSMNRAA